MKRRTFIQGMLAAGAAGGFRVPFANAADYTGKLFVFAQAMGGWDVTSLCDPKVNQPDEKKINYWADSDEVGEAGNILYAPFANNKAFFDKYYQRMLAINGVDAQTNSHDTGVIHNWSGRIGEGYPTTTALMAAHNGPALAMPYLAFDGYSNPAGVITYTRLDDTEKIQNIALPAARRGDPTDRPYYGGLDWQFLTQFRNARAARLAGAPNLMPRAAYNRALYSIALQPEATEGLREFASLVPEHDDSLTHIQRQAQLAVVAFKVGVAISADLAEGGFDTHDDHDREQGQSMAEFTDGVDYLWDQAEIHGIADRLVVVMGSDFSRTNHYNDDNGKDHWPYGSFIVMEKNQSWTNRVVGETNGLHFAKKVNPSTLEPDDTGTLIYPRHVHMALRKYLGIENSEDSVRFPFNNTEDMPFFS